MTVDDETCNWPEETAELKKVLNKMLDNAYNQGAESQQGRISLETPDWFNAWYTRHFDQRELIIKAKRDYLWLELRSALFMPKRNGDF